MKPIYASSSLLLYVVVMAFRFAYYTDTKMTPKIALRFFFSSNFIYEDRMQYIFLNKIVIFLLYFISWKLWWRQQRNAMFFVHLCNGIWLWAYDFKQNC